MIVKTYGFEWDVKPEADLNNFLDYLSGESGKKLDNQIIGCCKIDEDENLWGGFFLTVKDYRAFTEMEETGNSKFKITKKAIEKGKNHVDINFFIFNPETKRGLYQYYHHSAAMSLFGNFIGNKYLSFLHINEQEGRLRPMALFRREAFEKYLERFQQIRKVEFETISYDSIFKDTMQPLVAVASRSKSIFTYFATKVKDEEGLIASIKTLIERNLFSTLKVKGINSVGVEEVCKLLNDTDVFAQCEYEEFVNTVEIDTEDIENSIKNSDNIKNLTAIYNEKHVKIAITIKGE